MQHSTKIWHYFNPSVPKTLTPFLLSVVLILAIAVRWWSIWDYRVFFHFDQARDAFIVEDMLTHHDIKLQGPSASGTNETVFHGVLYYYLIAPLYYLTGYNPYFVTLVLAVLGASAVIPTYLLSKQITRSSWYSLVAAVLVAVSFEHSQASVWLSNPTLVASLSIWFYYFLWLVFFKHQTRYVWLLALFLGLNHQAVVVMIFLWASVAAAAIWQWENSSGTFFKHWSIKKIALSAATYLATISTMILVQIKMAVNGIWTVQSMQAASTSDYLQPNAAIHLIFELYLRKLSLSIFPSWPLLSLVAIGGFIFMARPLLKKAEVCFFTIWFLAPLALFSLHARNAYHALMGFEVAIWIVASVVMARVPKKNRVLTFGFIFIVIVSQFITLLSYRKQHAVVFSTETGMFLSDHVQTLKSMSASSKGQSFSYSALTTPYRYPITWAYLLHWYQRSQPTFSPYWYGDDQTGTVWSSFMSATHTRLPLHYALEENVSGIHPWMQSTFLASQPTTASAVIKNGAITLREYRHSAE